MLCGLVAVFCLAAGSSAALAAACDADADCEVCQVCVNGECKGMGLIVCLEDGDCQEGEVCQVDPEAACKNQCVKQAECTADEDCGACSVCVNGECMGMGLVACFEDGDCQEGEVCQVDPDAACKNQCVEAPAGDKADTTGTPDEKSEESSGCGLAGAGGGTGFGPWLLLGLLAAAWCVVVRRKAVPLA
jgi:hypothetical protein